jgi:hypothetical protein
MFVFAEPFADGDVAANDLLSFADVRPGSVDRSGTRTPMTRPARSAPKTMGQVANMTIAVSYTRGDAAR